MQLKFCPFPYFLEYTDGLPEGVGGRATVLTVRILNKYKDDIGIHKHESWHIIQRYLTLGLHSILKKMIPAYAKWVEVSAYRRQLKYPPANINPEAYITLYYAPALVNKYGLNITFEEAVKALS